ncbi:MAG: M48 family metallopeptidase [Clostridia bacterium]|nr:M48 family metallopeptidase [Clostridia bacterium]
MKFETEIIRSSRKTVAIEIKENNKVIVRAPYFVSDLKIEEFLNQKKGWILKHISIMENRNEFSKKLTPQDLENLIIEAKENIPDLVSFFAEEMSVEFNKIHIRSQKTRWGSCSAKGNLNFNCLLMLCPLYVREYIVVHELCHLKELNHSKRFWNLVEIYYPDYKTAKLWLKENGRQIIGKLG